MSCNASMYAVNSASAQYPAGSDIPFGSAMHGINKNAIYISGNAIKINGRGEFAIDVSATLTAGANGLVSIAIYKDGVPIPGATASASAAANNTVNLDITGVSHQRCCDDGAYITLVVTGVAVTLVNVATLVEKM